MCDRRVPRTRQGGLVGAWDQLLLDFRLAFPGREAEEPDERGGEEQLHREQRTRHEVPKLLVYNSTK